MKMERILSRMAIFALAVSLSGIFAACAPNRALTRDQLMGNRKPAYSANEKEYIYTYDDRGSRENLYTDAGEKPVRDRRNDNARVENDYIEYGKENTRSAPIKETFYQTGLASWYGREFHGRMTASGERFDMNELTAAHRTLPFGTVVEIKNINTGKSVQVTINDRGPYKKNRIIDLSYAAARRLDMLADGEAMVGIKILGKNKDGGQVVRDTVAPVSGFRIKEYEESKDRSPENETTPPGRAQGKYAIQAGAFYSKRKAEAFSKQIEDIVGRPVVVIQENLMYKVRIADIGTKTEASRLRTVLKKERINSYIMESRE